MDNSECYAPTNDHNALDLRIIGDILWSDPCSDDSVEGIHPNFERDPENTGKIVKFGKDLVDKFLCITNADYILRGHECVENGF
jgi:hypothetical protein